jgi:hypothetical protein
MLLLTFETAVLGLLPECRLRLDSDNRDFANQKKLGSVDICHALQTNQRLAFEDYCVPSCFHKVVFLNVNRT